MQSNTNFLELCKLLLIKIKKSAQITFFCAKKQLFYDSYRPVCIGKW